jgi:hypothetical protein
MVLDHGTAFFASRLINPARKCDLVDDLVGRGAGNPRQRYEAAWARFFTAGDTNGLTRPSHPFWKSAIHTRRRVARTVGAIWGYYLYESYVKGLVETEWIRAVFLGAGGNDPGRLFREGLEVGRGGVRVSSKMSLL